MKLLQDHILRLVFDLIPAEEGLLLLGASAAELRARYKDRASQYTSDFAPFFSRVSEEGAFEDAEQKMIGVPLYLGRLRRRAAHSGTGSRNRAFGCSLGSADRHRVARLHWL